MKKLVTILLTLLMIASSFVYVSAADASPVKAYADAKDGDLLYTVNFNGDSVFTPAPIAGAENYFDFTPNTDGSSITIKGKTVEGEKVSSYWGGNIEGLVATQETNYSMVYKVRANGTTGSNNSIGIGGWIIDSKPESASFYNNYGNHNTVDENNNTNIRRSAVSKGTAKLDDYKMWATLRKSYNIDADGFVTMLLEFDAEKKRVSSYILMEDGSEKVQADWIKLQSASMSTFNNVDDNMGLMFYVYHHDAIDTTVKNVSIYKGTVYEKVAATTTVKTTTAATTAAATTAAATTTAATTVAEKGCGSALAITSIAIVPALGCAFIGKKKKED